MTSNPSKTATPRPESTPGKTPPPPNPNPQPKLARPKQINQKAVSVARRINLINTVMAVPLLVTTGLLLGNYLNNLDVARRQALAAVPYKQMQAIQFNVRSMRGYKAEEVPKQYLEAATNETKLLISELEKAKLTQSLVLARQIEKETAELVNAIEARNISADGIIDGTAGILFEELKELFEVLSEEGKLFVSPNNSSYALANMATSVLPEVLPRIGAEFGKIIVQVDKIRTERGGQMTSADVAEMNALLRAGRNYTDNFEQAVTKVYRASPSLKASLEPVYKKAITDTRNAFDLAERGTLESSAAVSVTPGQLIEISDIYLVSQYQAFDATVKALEREYAARSQRALLNLLTLLLGIGLLGAIAYAVSRRITKSITEPLNELTIASDRLSRGDLNVRVPIVTNDEVGRLAKAFNMAALTLQTNEEHVKVERKEAQRLQSNIGEFLDVTLDIADGDLTKRGRVTEDILGNVVDSINLMADELSHLLLEVQQASKSVDSGSAAMLYTTAQILDSSSRTTEQTTLVTEQARNVTEQIQRMAELARSSADTARLALQASEEGQNAVQSTLENMQNLRTSSQMTSERVLSLTRRSEEIQEIVDYISQITGQVNLLSLHASIEAAGAGEAGGRFAVVAEEVRQLAELSTSATDRIAALIANIQAEIKQVTRSIQSNVSDVEKGYTVAGKAGERLREIALLTEESAKLAVNIASATTIQVDEVNRMEQGMSNIASIVEKNQISVQSGKEAAEQLRALAQQLNSSLQRFKLPETDISQS